MHRMSLIFFIFAAGCAGTKTPESTAPIANKTTSKFVQQQSVSHFYKGNLHTHTSKSDGDSDPESVTRWYRNHGYDFLALTDHDKLVDATIYDEPFKFLTIPGDELTGRTHHLPVHVNALCGKSNLKAPRPPLSISDTIRMLVEMAHQDGAIALLNHPNFAWALSATDLLESEGYDLLEITSGHPEVNEDGLENGIQKAPSHEALWDIILSHGSHVWGVGSDDSHYYKVFDKEKANPGRAWVEVAAAELTKESICDALRRGRFYVSRGPKILWWSVTENNFELNVDSWRNFSGDKVEFIGSGGKILKTVREMPAAYSILGNEGYVRARITQNDERAWTQPYFVNQ